MCFLQNCFLLSYLWHCAQQRGRLFTGSAKLRIWEKVNNSVGNKDSKSCGDSKKQRYAAVLYKSSLNGKMLFSPSKEWISLSGHCEISQPCPGLCAGSFSIEWFCSTHPDWEGKKKRIFGLQLEDKTIFIRNKSTCLNHLERADRKGWEIPKGAARWAVIEGAFSFM